MNCTLTRATSTELNTYSTDASLSPDASSARNTYATAPMAAILPPYQLPSEEELHTSFEQAISQRTSALHEQLSRYSYPALSIQQGDHLKTTSTVRQAKPIQLFPSSGWRRIIVLSGLALTFMLIGFDLMGLLVLHMH